MPQKPGGARPPDPAGPGRAALTRRRMLRGGLAGAGALALGGAASSCGSPAQLGAGSSVRFWNLFTGGDGALMERIISEVEKEASSLDIESTVLAWGAPYYTKLAMASAGGRAPELAIMHMSRLPGYAPGGLLEPFDLDLLAEFGLTEEHIQSNLWRRSQYDGGQYAIPLDLHPFIVFYDTELADQAGMLNSDGKLRAFESPEDFIEASRRLADATGKGGVAFGHVNDAAQGWRMFWALYRQTGATMKLPPGGEPEFDEDAALRAFTFVADLCDGETSSNTLDYFAALGGFTSGRSGLIFTGEWELAYFREAMPNLGAAPMPTFFDQPASYADSHSFVLPRQSNPDPRRVRAAHKAVAMMLHNSLIWAEAGHVPAYQPVVESQEYQDLSPQSDYAAAAEHAVLDPQTWFAGAGSTFQNEASQTMATALMGVGPEAAVEELRGVLKEYLAKPNPLRGGA